MREIYEDPKTGRCKWREKQPASEPPVRLRRMVRWILTKIQIAWHRYRADRNNYWMLRDYWQGLKYCSDFRRERRDYHVAQIERLESKNPPNEKADRCGGQ